MSAPLPLLDGPSSSTTSRRRFLQLAALSFGAGAGIAACGAAPTATAVPPTPTLQPTATPVVVKEVTTAVPKVPWSYANLDVETTRKLGHSAYYQAGCAYGAFAAILGQLQQKVGFPYTQIPIELVNFGGAGVAGWGTLCGSLLGSSMVMSLIIPAADTNKVISELMTWYCDTAFPSDVSNQLAVNHQFLVKEYKSDKVLPTSVSGSPLCHVSVSKWCAVSQLASGSNERAERCGRLTGDVAAHAVELINAYFGKTFAANSKLSAEAQTCMTCHTVGTNYAAGNSINGKGECLQCHDAHPPK